MAGQGLCQWLAHYMRINMRKHFRFTGKVQNTGFRTRANHFANGMGLTGWVKNNPDGSVEMEAQGTEEQINMLLVRINQSEYIQIDKMETTIIDETNDKCFFTR